MMKILDAGCGTGVITRVLYSLAQEKRYEDIQFHAFDLTPDMLEIFRQWVAGQGASNIELKQADVMEIGELPPHWAGYDLIVSSTMLEYISRHQVRDAVSNLRQLLKKGGIFLTIITRRNLITRLLAEKWWKTNLYRESEIQALLQEAGFGTVEFKKLSPGWSNSILVIEAKKEK